MHSDRSLKFLHSDCITVKINKRTICPPSSSSKAYTIRIAIATTFLLVFCTSTVEHIFTVTVSNFWPPKSFSPSSWWIYIVLLGLQVCLIPFHIYSGSINAAVCVSYCFILQMMSITRGRAQFTSRSVNSVEDPVSTAGNITLLSTCPGTSRIPQRLCQWGNSTSASKVPTHLLRMVQKQLLSFGMRCLIAKTKWKQRTENLSRQVQGLSTYLKASCKIFIV